MESPLFPDIVRAVHRDEAKHSVHATEIACR